MNLQFIVPDKVSTPAKMFLAASTINGFANGMFNVVFMLYLTSFGFDSAALSPILMMSPIVIFSLTIPAGILSGRLGPKKMMVLLMIPWTLFSLIVVTADSIPMFMLAFLLIGMVDSIANVILGPLYASFFDNENMDRAFSLQAFLNILTVSLGSLIGFLPPVLQSSYGFSLRSAYWVVILMGVILFFVQVPFFFYAVLRAPWTKKKENGFKLNLKSKSVVGKVALLYLLTNVGFGMFFSFFPYYVNKKFGLKSDALGGLYFVSNFIRAGATLSAPRISQKLGTLKTITLSTLTCVPFYLMIPLAPDFIWLSVFYSVRLFLGNISSPLTGSLYMKLLYPDERATANAFTSMASNGGNVMAPWIGGRLMEQVSLDAPAFLGSGVYVLFGSLYYLLLRTETVKKKEENKELVV